MRTRITPNTDTFHAVYLANIFMVELENTIVPSLHEDSSFWKQYDDDIYVMPAHFGTIFTISKTISHGGLTFSKNWDH